ncbi:MAG: GIY-YIG nuclease family protein [Marinilabiliales bacterium]|nr:GIY-YIG nuclease family protein [Marinilabiliales bacterium]
MAFFFMPATYILFSEKLNKFYIGATHAEPAERLKKHLTDHDGFTAKAKDWRIVFSHEFSNYSDALALEKKIKSWKSRKRIESFINQIP